MENGLNKNPKINWEVRYYRDGDKEKILHLSKYHYGDRDQAKEGYFDWLNSLAPGGLTTINVCENLDTGEIIGFSFLVPFELKVGDYLDVCYLGCNLLVKPGFRRQGIYRAINEKIKQTSENSLFIYGFPKPTAVTSHEKMGRKFVSDISLLIRPLDIDFLIDKRLHNPLLKPIGKLGLNLLSQTIWRPAKISQNKSDIHIKIDDYFDEKFDDLWERLKHKYKILIKRDRKFLNWRFNSSNFRHYQILSAYRREQILGYIVTRNTAIEGIPTGLIMDFLVVPSEWGNKAGLMLVDMAMKIFQNDKMVLTGCLMLPHTHEYTILKKAGYINAPARLSPQEFQLRVFPRSSRVPLEDLTTATNWFITMANHDAV